MKNKQEKFMSTLPLKPVVDVYYNLDAVSTVRQGFNLGAIVGSSNVISQSTRGVVFNSVDEMLEYGFISTQPEVLAAQIYFSAESNPNQLYVGRWVETSSYATRYYNGAISNGNIVTIGETAYTVGDGTGETATLEAIVEAATEAGATTATYTDTTLYIMFTAATEGSAGEPTALSVTQGSGSKVSSVIFTPGEDAESFLEAVQAMKTANSNWYAFASLDFLPVDTIQSVAAYVESTSGNNPITYFAHTNDSNVINGYEGNLFETLKGLKYERTCGIATTKPYTHVGIMGYAMGQTRTTADSSYTLAIKPIPGTQVDGFTSQQVTAIESNYGNVYINRGSYYDMFERGTVFSGGYYDEIIQLDKVVNDIQLSVMDLLYANPKIPQTEPGLALILTTIETGCRQAVKVGFVAPGQWNGGNVLNLENGTYLPNGYLIQAETFESQSQADRDARKAPNIYVALKLAGAIQSVVIQIDVNR